MCPQLGLILLLKHMLGGRRNGSAVKSIGCSFRRPRLEFQRLHSGSQLSVTPVFGDLMSFSGLHKYQTLMQAKHPLHKMELKINFTKVRF